MIQQVHDLTMLYMKNSVDTIKIKTPEEYGRKYQDVYGKIADMFGTPLSDEVFKVR